MDAYRAIENLLYLYAERLDAGDLEGVAELFHNATITAPGPDKPVEGRDGALEMYRNFTRIYPNGTPCTQHVMSNARIEVDAANQTATANSRATVFQATDALSMQPIIAVRYEDKFARDGDSWHFTERAMITLFHGDLSHHLLAPIP